MQEELYYRRSRYLEGRILITGGAGFLGRAIMARAQAEDWPCEFVVYSRDELKQAQCKRKFPVERGSHEYILGDIRDADRLEIAMMSCDAVIHAAALKYVPEGEINVSECVSINVGGTQAVLDAARRAKVERVVCISTDKAVQPVNVYGMTKALLERLVDERSAHMRVVAVRYGNVIGSTGSVIPEILYKFRNDLPVNVTDPSMTRFWMAPYDAIDLILEGMYHATNGSVLVQASKSMSLANLVEALKEATPNNGQHIVNVVGARLGERKHETLLTEQEAVFAWEAFPYYELPSTLNRGKTEPNINAPTITSNTCEQWDSKDLLPCIEEASDI